MILSTFKINVSDISGVTLPPEFGEFCGTLQPGSYYLQLRDDSPESKFTQLMLNSIHGDMGMLSKATDFNISPNEWKVTCKLMRPDLFVYTASFRHPITGERPDIIRSLTDPALSRADILDWMSTYRMRMEEVWYDGNSGVVPPVKPLKEVYTHTPTLYWYTQNDLALRQIAEK